jgi:predicted O-methyltransferase YrrM
MNSSEIIKKLQQFQAESGYFKERIVCKKNWGSLKYWRYRIMRPLIKLKYKSFRKKHYPTPWLTPAAILFFQKWLTNEKNGAEFGSGISTVFFAQRSKHVVSIEHFEPWYKKVVDLFKEEGLRNVTYNFIPPVSNSKEQSLQSEVFNQYDLMKYENDIMWEYFDYFRALDAYESGHFDYVLVDGRARPECLVHAIDKLKSGGLMVLDNSERNRYKIVFELLKEWPSFTTSTGLTNTTFWVKP